MPANKKYLTPSPLQRTLKITAGFFGGYAVSMGLHQFIMWFLPAKDVWVTMNFTAYIVWAFLLLFAFLAKSGWKIWGWYILTAGLLFSPYFIAHFIK